MKNNFNNKKNIPKMVLKKSDEILLVDFQLMYFYLMDYIVNGLQLLMDFQLMDYLLMEFIVDGLCVDRFD